MEDLGIAMLAGAGIGAIIGAIWVGYYLVRAIAEWRIFTKAGEKGWKSLIPFLNVYTEYKLTANTKQFGIYMLFVVLAAIGQQCTSDAFVAKCIIGILNLAVTVLTIKRWNYLSKAFGKGIGYTIGLFILHPIFIILLGIGNSKYIGPSED